MRVVFAGTAAALGAMVFGGLASAQNNAPIEERQTLMKANNRHAILMTKMVKGEEPYAAAKVNAAFSQWEETAGKIGALFSDDSKTGHDTRALPKIWAEKGEFNSYIADFGKDVKAQKAKAASGLDGLKQAMEVVNHHCDGCHDEYRAKKK